MQLLPVFTVRSARREYRRDLGREIRSFDYLLLAIITAIVFLSILSIGACTADPMPEEISFWRKVLSLTSVRYPMLQLLWFGTGLILLFLAAFLWDYETYTRLYYLFYGASVLLLLVLWIVGESTRGAISWFTIGERGVQPSEFCKIAIIICLAALLGEDDRKITSFAPLVRPLVFFAVPFALIMLQPDLGTALVYLFVLVGMLFVAGINWKIILSGIGAAALAIPLAVKFLLNDDQKLRLSGFFGVDASVSGVSDKYQLTQSKLAIGSGGMTGKGFLSAGTISQLHYVPDQHTDFIFSAAAETFGFVGAAILIALYLLLVLRLLYMAWKTPDRTGQLLIVGVAAMFFFHVFENIGMTIGVMPITGIPLPFMSYGGSSMWTNMIAIGLAENAYCRRNRVRYTDKGLFQA